MTTPPLLDISIRDYYLTTMSHQLYDVFFGHQRIHTLVTRDSSKVENWLESYIANLETNIVGLEIQLLPGSNIAATLQLCVCVAGGNSSGGGSRSSIQCLVYQLIHKARHPKTDELIHKVSIIPQSLVDFLGNPRNIFMGAGTVNLADTLTSQFKDLKVGLWFDVLDFVIHEKEVSVMPLLDPAAQLVDAATHLFFKNFSNYTLVWQPVWDPWDASNAWDSKMLTPKQVQYACVAAYLPYRIGRLYEVEIAKSA